jgi:hypothetical protein
MELAGRTLDCRCRKSLIPVPPEDRFKVRAWRRSSAFAFKPSAFEFGGSTMREISGHCSLLVVRSARLQTQRLSSVRRSSSSVIVIVCAIITLVATIFAFVYFISEPRGGDDYSYWTKFYLRSLVQYVRMLPYDDLNDIKTLDQFLAELERRQFMKNTETYRTDMWNTPLFWTIERKQESITIRFISAGKNKIPEGGHGDDIWVEIERQREGKIAYRQSWLEAQVDRDEYGQTGRELKRTR